MAYTFICDGCENAFVAGSDISAVAVEEAKKMEWTIIKDGDETLCYCPGCKSIAKIQSKII